MQTTTFKKIRSCMNRKYYLYLWFLANNDELIFYTAEAYWTQFHFSFFKNGRYAGLCVGEMIETRTCQAKQNKKNKIFCTSWRRIVANDPWQWLLLENKWHMVKDGSSILINTDQNLSITMLLSANCSCKWYDRCSANSTVVYSEVPMAYRQ